MATAVTTTDVSSSAFVQVASSTTFAMLQNATSHELQVGVANAAPGAGEFFTLKPGEWATFQDVPSGYSVWSKIATKVNLAGGGGTPVVYTGKIPVYKA